MTTPEKSSDINSRLCAAQAKMPSAVLDMVNPHFKSRYASLASITTAAVPSLNSEGIAVSQPLVLADGEFKVQTQLRLSGTDQILISEYPVARGTPQQMGSNITYGRRQSLAAICCIIAEEDDDAEVAEGSAGVPRAQEKKSAYRSRKDGDWDILKQEMAAIATAHGLKIWGVANSERIHALPDSWQAHFRELYNAKLTELAEGVNEKGTPLKQQLEASLAADEGEAD